MMRPIIIFIVACLLVAPAHAQYADLSEYLETVRTIYDLPALAAAVVKGGEVVAAGAVGTRVYDMEIPVTIDDRFHLGSITKAMTATLAGMMVDEGKLRWDSTIGEVLGDDIEGMNATLAAVTLSQLLSHTGGIPSTEPEILDRYDSSDAFDYNLPRLRQLALDAWKENEPFAPQIPRFRYSNFGYLIAGMMIEKAAAKSWEQLMHERLFGPLELESAGIGPQATVGLFDAPVEHWIDDDGQVTPMPWGPAADRSLVTGPMGRVHMSILDLAKWAAWNAGIGQRGPALVSPETLGEIHDVHVDLKKKGRPLFGMPRDEAYGFGWSILQFYWVDRPVLYHTGSNGLNYAVILIDVADDLAVVVTTNFPAGRAYDSTREVMQHLYLEFVTQ